MGGGASVGSSAGTSVAFTGGVTTGGTAELLVGAPNAGSGGMVYLFDPIQ